MNLFLRVLVAVVFLPLFLWLSRSGGTLFFLYVEALILIGSIEYYSMLGPRVCTLFRIAGVVFALGCGALFFFCRGNGSGPGPLLYTFGILLFFLLRWLFSGREESSLEEIGLSLLGILYVGFLFSHQIILREYYPASHGTELSGWYYLLFPYLIVWTSDTSAYFVGKLFGKHRLAPRLSPGKTVEGAAGGFIFSMMAVLAYQYFASEYISLVDALLLGPLVAIVCQLGDIVESRIKREMGVKDSSSFIPGHGGILDRYDGILVAVPVTYYYFVWISPIVTR